MKLDNKTKEALESAGLITSEALVYVALLRLHKATAGEISKFTGMYRPNVHLAAQKLVQKGLASYSELNNRVVYKPARPSRLIDIISERRAKLSAAIASLEAEYTKVKAKHETNIFEGPEGLRTVMDKIVARGGIVYSFGGAMRILRVMPQVWEFYKKLAIERGMKVYIIMMDRPDIREEVDKIGPNFIARFMPEKYIGPTAWVISKDYLYLVIWGETILVIEIRSKEISQGFIKNFKILWNVTKQ